MKILCVGDQHYKFVLSYSSSFEDGRRNEWEQVIKTIHNSAKECDAVVLLGDGFNARHNHSTVIRDFIDFLNGFGEKEVHILVGNHERYSLSTALDFLKSFGKKNWHVYDEPTQITVGDKTAMMIPFVTPSLLGVENIDHGNLELAKRLKKSDMAFAHLAISGASSTEFFNEIILDRKVMSEMFNVVYGGHLHRYEKLEDNVYVAGSIFTQEVGEHDKRIFILDTDTNKHEEIFLPVRGIYKEEWSSDSEKKLGAMPSTSIVKCVVIKRETDIALVRETLKRFDASILIEQYDNERSKIHFEDSALDLSVDSLLKMYSESKKIQYTDLLEGFNFIR